jgi:spore coat protein A, manganese oxidase
MVTRREFLKISLAAGAGIFLPVKYFDAQASAPSMKTMRLKLMSEPSLDPLAITKYTDPLTIPPAMPRKGKITVKGGKNADYYEIAVQEFMQQVLPAGYPLTKVWSYGVPGQPATFNYPAFTIEARWNTPVRVKWVNGLVDSAGNYLPHLLKVDQTLHWANPPGGEMGRDMRPMEMDLTAEPYTGPVPIVTHVHGAHTTDESDGYAEAWFLPAAKNIPASYATEGTWYNNFKMQAAGKGFVAPGTTAWEPGTSVSQYPNDQAATTLWYHDHTLGMTRLNVYAGPAGFYLLRGGPTDRVKGKLPGPAPALRDRPGRQYYEIPIAIQDRMFNDDGSLFFPDSRAFFDGFAGPYTPDMTIDEEMSDIPPIWNPEFFGNTMVVNGKTWPKLVVEPRRYRFRLLNGCNSRFLVLRMEGPQAPSFWMIGAEGGFLPAPVNLSELLMAPAERADVIVDFTGLPVGTQIIMTNYGPDEPYGGGIPGVDFDPANPDTTGQVMMFEVGPLLSADKSTPPDALIVPVLPALPLNPNVRRVSLHEEDSSTVFALEDSDPPEVVSADTPGAVPFGPRVALLGHYDPDEGMFHPDEWMHPITENIAVGANEIWEIFNFTMDAHPIHIHQVMFKVIDREMMDMDMMGMPMGAPRPAEAWETGFKDTVIALPGEITRVQAVFDLPGLYVWHCHIVDHEDNEMMRPFRVA